MHVCLFLCAVPFPISTPQFLLLSFVCLSTQQVPENLSSRPNQLDAPETKVASCALQLSSPCSHTHTHTHIHIIITHTHTHTHTQLDNSVVCWIRLVVLLTQEDQFVSGFSNFVVVASFLLILVLVFVVVSTRMKFVVSEQTSLMFLFQVAKDHLFLSSAGATVSLSFVVLQYFFAFFLVLLATSPSLCVCVCVPSFQARPSSNG